MYKYKSPKIWVLPLLVLLMTYKPKAFAQCPLTKSTTFKMMPQGLPNRIPVKPIDFFVNKEDVVFYQKMALSQDHFVCHEVGIQEVLLSGINIATNDTFACEQYVWVIDSVFLCSSEIKTPKAVAGKITTDQGVLVPNIAVGLTSEDSSYFKGTNERGAFFFDNFEAQQYELMPNGPFDNNVRNGITTFDVLILQKHILNLRPLDSPYKLIAADLNNSGDVTAFDMLLLRQMILAVINDFPNTPSWRFVDAAHEFEDERNPFSAPIPSSISIDAVNVGPQLDNRFIAIKMGDLNNTATLNVSGRSKAKEVIGKPLLKIVDKPFKQGDLLNVPFVLTKNLTLDGLQFALNYDQSYLRLMDITGQIDLANEDYATDNGILKLSWTKPESTRFTKEETVVNLQFRATEDGLLSEVLTLVPAEIAPIIYSTTDGSIPFSIDWSTKALPITDFKAFNNYPNPFINQTNISFLLPADSPVTLRVFDNNGRTVLTKQEAFLAGKQTIQLTEKLPTAGLYFYRLESEFGVATGRMNYMEK